MKVGVRGHFDSMHRLPGHPKCGTPHGHTYTVEAQVEGELKGGMVIDFDHLKSALRETLTEFDHTDLNAIIEVPTCENLCMEIHRRLQPQIQGTLRIRIWEGEGKWAEHP